MFFEITDTIESGIIVFYYNIPCIDTFYNKGTPESLVDDTLSVVSPFVINTCNMLGRIVVLIRSVSSFSNIK